jgi:hypothetical protein
VKPDPASPQRSVRQQAGGHRNAALLVFDVVTECAAPANEPVASAAVATSIAAIVFFEVTARFICFTSFHLRASVEGAANATVMAGQRVSNDVRFTVDHLAVR